MKFICRNFCISLALIGASLHSVQAATVTGTVANTMSQPIAGALVTLWNEAHNRKETVYTDAAGNI